jgi:alanine racemase
MIEAKRKQNRDQMPNTGDWQLATGNCDLSRRPTWVEVDLNAIAENYRTLVSLLPSKPLDNAPFSISNPRVMPVIKADAYGHGMIPVARALAAAGATAFAVGFVDEGVRLREAGILQEILVMGTAWNGQQVEAVQNNLMLAVDSVQRLQSLEDAARNSRVSVPIHIKVDTGMARLGVRWNAMEPLLSAATKAENVSLRGTFSHLSSADESDFSYTMEQIRRFEHSLSTIQASGLDCGEIHLANSAGFIYFDPLQHWSARVGLALYGYNPDPQRAYLNLRPALSLKTKIGPTRSIKEGETVGYSRKYKASRETRLTTLCIGYADGFNRRLGNRAKVIIQDQYAPVIGNVSMDMIAVDLTDVPGAREGDEVTILGSSPHCSVTADDWASILETVPYEVLCGITPRIPRIYI